MLKNKANKSRIFTPDSHNLGGRTEITNLIYNHQISLLNAKPTLNIRCSTPKGSSTKKKPISYKEIIQYKEVFESFRRAGNVKWSNISSPPKTFYMKDMLRRNDAKAYKYALFEHQLNLNSQKKRIDDLNTVTQRKKNLFDSTVHPSLFFRRKNDTKQSNTFTSVDHNIELQENHENYNEKHEDEELRTRQKNIFEKLQGMNKNKSEIIEEVQENEGNGQENDNEYFLIPIPEVKGKSENDYQDLKLKLIELIYQYRIFKNEDLESLFGRTLIHNKHMDSKKLQKIFKEIQDDFDS